MTVLDGAVGGALVGGAAICAVVAVRRRRGRPAALAFGAALACAGVRELAGAEGSLWLSVVACALALGGVGWLIARRLGPPSGLSWLDAVTGGSAVGALAVSAGLPAGPTIALAGAAAGLGASRWRLSPGLAGGIAGLALLTDGGPLAVAAVPALLVAVLREEPRVGPGPEFNLRP